MNEKCAILKRTDGMFLRNPLGVAAPFVYRGVNMGCGTPADISSVGLQMSAVGLKI